MGEPFLDGTSASKARWRDPEAEKKGIRPIYRWTGPGRDGLEVVQGEAGSRPNTAAVREVWKGRHGHRAAPLLVVISLPGDRAVVCGPTGDDPRVVDLDLRQAERLAEAAIGEPTRHLAIRFLAEALEGEPDEHPGLRNKGLLATHELLYGVPKREDWEAATERSRPLMNRRGQDLVRGLGYEIDAKGSHSVLRSSEERAQAVAVFLEDREQPDQPSPRFENQTPVTYALSHADRDNIPWVVAERGGGVRLYSTSTSGAAGQRGRTETFVELNLPLLPTDQAGYLDLLFSSRALAEGGSVAQIQHASSIYTSDLSGRLRERVYKQVVPRLAVAVAESVGGTSEKDLESHYRAALTILFRLMFVAYAEDSRLLPLNVYDEYTRNSLKAIARDLSRSINAGHDLGFDNPLTEEVEPHTDTSQTYYWDDCKALFRAVRNGEPAWGVPAYGGGLFSDKDEVNPVGGIIEGLTLTNAEFGPALAALIVDESPEDEIVGPIDFRSLSVREFGTIYEGLLESELSVAGQPLAVNKDGVYLPAGDGDRVEVEAGAVYLHNQSGVRKSTGSYFTKPFAVDHLISHSVDPTLKEHLDRVKARLDEGKEADAATLLFDFRVADIAMGSGHFLTAVVDRLEARYNSFLTEHPIPQVSRELDGLRETANVALGQLADTVEIENSSLLRRLIARRCVYGVDLNPLSVELARVGMWIHTFVPGLPLSFLDHNLVAGDSLTGIGTIEEATAELVSTGAQASLFDDPLREDLRKAEEPLRRLANIADATIADVAQAREAAADVEEAVDDVAGLFDLVVAARTGEVPAPSITSLKELQTLETAYAREVVKAMRVVHFPVAFPEVFLRERSGFDVIIGNPPWDKVRHEPQQFWAVRAPGLLALSEPKQKAEIARLRLERSLDAQAEVQEAASREKLQSLIDRAFRLQGRGQHGHHDFAKLFVERALSVQHEKGTLAYVLPRPALVLGGWTDLRKAILDDSRVTVLQARNKQGWLFDEIDSRLMIALVIRSGGSGPVLVWPSVLSVEQLRYASVANAIKMTRSEIDDLTDKSVVPWFGSPNDQKAFDVLRSFPRLGRRNGWITGFADSSRWDFSTTGSHKRFVTDTETRDTWRVLMTRHVDAYRVADEDKFRRFVSQPRDLSELRLGIEMNNGIPSIGEDHPIIVYRYPSRNDDARTLIATVLPNSGYIYSKGYVHGVRTSSDTDPEATLALLGLMNSFICDWWVRRFVDRHVTKQVLESIPLPRWSEKDTGEVAGHVAALLMPHGIEKIAGNRSITKYVSTSQSPDDHVVEIEHAVMRGFEFTKSELRSIMQDFTTKACPPDLLARLMKED